MDRYAYTWRLADGYPQINKEIKVFGTFISGGGSTMGYKKAGCNHLGGVEIDPVVAETYKINHNPKYLYTEDIRDFNKREDLPGELYDLDILDGSPPCSTFSIAGQREKAWGKEKVFAEGQKEQRLDDLFFDYIDTIEKLKPKVFIAENVKGLILGNAKAYIKTILKAMDNIGYITQVFLLNSATMGVPQRRERVFIVGRKKELDFKDLKLNFNDRPIPYKEFMTDSMERALSGLTFELWENLRPGEWSLEKSYKRLTGKTGYFSSVICPPNKVVKTLTASQNALIKSHIPAALSTAELHCVSTFPVDYKAKGRRIDWFMGMSVPPIMMQRLAEEILKQWFNIKY